MELEPLNFYENNDTIYIKNKFVKIQNNLMKEYNHHGPLCKKVDNNNNQFSISMLNLSESNFSTIFHKRVSPMSYNNEY
ncbi:hypothetical protein BCR32DRAFT_277267 [Anaeromyces robustus]|uniref:Uncharacterized protein n=1 Tax=Anaeromyces robustus TaxID=1754192 RepID=A0A1Y1XEW6_9FUNG|nr:hypothetical protein BCR32DRAFT_277267 [Anaeromyces robustus]|eukprot:ORX84285.1 hypothetical protein BCR32DRAFT_277267 [Anaeromyces robustus]